MILIFSGVLALEGNYWHGSLMNSYLQIIKGNYKMCSCSHKANSPDNEPVDGKHCPPRSSASSTSDAPEESAYPRRAQM